MSEIFLFYPKVNVKTYFILFDIHLRKHFVQNEIKTLIGTKKNTKFSFTVHVKYKIWANITLKIAIFN